MDAGASDGGNTVVADVGAPHPASDAPSTKLLFVREKMVDCDAEGPTRCLEVRDSEESEWSLFYGRIDGFVHEEGYRYTLRVTTNNSPSRGDGPKRRYRLVEIVHAEKVSP
jgi:hypothetical protein